MDVKSSKNRMGGIFKPIVFENFNKIFFVYLFCFLVFSSGYAAPRPLLKMTDVRPTIEELLNYHVEFQEITPLLIKRSFKVYIEQFDNAKSYLLQNEIQAFYGMDEQGAFKTIAQYQSDDFSNYFALNQLIQNAIFRARSWRQEIERELVLNAPVAESQIGESYLNFAADEKELRQRLKKQLTRLLLEEKKLHHLENWAPSDRQKIFALWEKRFHRKEENYVLTNTLGQFLDRDKSEHYFVVHILKALAKSLDTHTSYFTPEEALEMRASLEKQFEGVGVILRESIDGVVISDIVKGGPAEKSGQLILGDLLVEIDGKSLQGASYEEVLAAMKANGKNEIILGIKRKQHSDKIVHVALKREKIVMQKERLQFSSEPYAGGVIGKLVLPSFYESGQQSSAEIDIREAIRKLKASGKLIGLILDLRENSGGFLNQAVKVAGLFITRGVIVISKYARGEVKYLRDLDGRIYYEGPLVILTSKASASAAEIVAQALQDYGTALIVGDERTYGKGTIQYQTVTEEDAKSYFKVTVGRYYTVSGKSTQINGVRADIVVPTEFSLYNIGERFLDYPLSSDAIASAFTDPLTDVPAKDIQWFQKNYLPNLHQPESGWQKMLPLLVSNSSFRLQRDKDFALFLQFLKKKQEAGLSIKKAIGKENWGIEDLQMTEAVNILKDMIILKASNPLYQTGSPSSIKN